MKNQNNNQGPGAVANNKDQQNQENNNKGAGNGNKGGSNQNQNSSSAAAQQNNKHNNITIGHYVLGKHLGKGTFGNVKQGVHTLTNEKVAVKILEKDKIHDQKDVERITREIKILKKVRHNNVIQLYEIIETEKELFMIMEYPSGGELFNYIVRHTKLQEKQACKFYQELIAGIEYLHQSGVCHRDLKPENLLLDYDQTLKIVDFGLSNMYEKNQLLKTACGSPCYAAPEMIAGKKYHGIRTDIWSSGVVLYAMVCGYLPFEDPKTSNLYKKIMNAQYTLPKFLSSDCKDMLTRILNTNSDERYKISDIRSHPWTKRNKELVFEKGLFPGVQKMPFSMSLLDQLIDDYGFEKEYSIKCLEANRHNHITATYHLINKRNIRNKHLKEGHLQIAQDPKKLKSSNAARVYYSQNTRQNNTIVNGQPDHLAQDSQGGRVTNNQQEMNMTIPVSTGINHGKLNAKKIMNDALFERQRNDKHSVDYHDIGRNRTYTSAYNKRVTHHTQNANAHSIVNGVVNGTIPTGQHSGGSGSPVSGKGDIISSNIRKQSQSPDKYIIGNNFVVNLNDKQTKNMQQNIVIEKQQINNYNQLQQQQFGVSGPGQINMQPVKVGVKKQFYQTQTSYNKQGNSANTKGSFFPSTATATTNQSNGSNVNTTIDVNTDTNSSLVSRRPPTDVMHQRFRSINAVGGGQKNQPNMIPNQQHVNHQQALSNSFELNLPLRFAKNHGTGQKIRQNHQQQISQTTKNAWQAIEHNSNIQNKQGSLLIQNIQYPNQATMAKRQGTANQTTCSQGKHQGLLTFPDATTNSIAASSVQNNRNSPRGDSRDQVRKNNFYAVHGRAINMQGGSNEQTKTILNKIFKNQHKSKYSTTSYNDSIMMNQTAISGFGNFNTRIGTGSQGVQLQQQLQLAHQQTQHVSTPGTKDIRAVNGNQNAVLAIGIAHQQFSDGFVSSQPGGGQVPGQTAAKKGGTLAFKNSIGFQNHQRIGTSGMPHGQGLNIQELYNHYQSSSNKNPNNLSSKQSELTHANQQNTQNHASPNHTVIQQQNNLIQQQQQINQQQQHPTANNNEPKTTNNQSKVTLQFFD